MPKKLYRARELIGFYRQGLFPMAEGAGSNTIHIIDPEVRTILPLEGFHVPRRLARTVRSDKFQMTINQEFDAVVNGCAEAAPGREDTWINDWIRDAYHKLHWGGHAHSVETRLDGALVGGLYGVAIGGAFFGESMFSRETDASKIALVHLVARLIAGGFTLLDTQFTTSHLRQFGTVELRRAAFQQRLAAALEVPAAFTAPAPMTGAQALQRIAQMS